ncbi:hypothetical protein [Phaeobacter inhibens]|uniref:hypothetical protein n=1 Tax=Phaeobacter inhibens TaxID=221822 RepID=UPI000C9C7C63|nr:hypothetical protein [Phaeobacter inhibens]AUQ63188.1 hypothetical protein PhaeoP51_02217 [Phaeobacter inhibens]AUQ83092.1 hypothetical protein PhaeoP57_02176 [Phaeobacter inhibens]AUQ90853.1 hypothetical protein PhaeoP24_02250 [Phaeobacter inhibens]MDO6757615.1 hypothetical protein [Phaeobacter inhibens]
MTDFQFVTSQENVEFYRTSEEIFSGLIKEMRELSKKKADATLSKGKVKILNRVLDDIRNLLEAEPEAKFLDELDDDELPQNSDAVLIMVQYESALVAFRKRYRRYVSGLGERWITKEFLETR